MIGYYSLFNISIESWEGAVSQLSKRILCLRLSTKTGEIPNGSMVKKEKVAYRRNVNFFPDFCFTITILLLIDVNMAVASVNNQNAITKKDCLLILLSCTIFDSDFNIL